MMNENEIIKAEIPFDYVNSWSERRERESQRMNVKVINLISCESSWSINPAVIRLLHAADARSALNKFARSIFKR